MTGIFNQTKPHSSALAAADRLEELLRTCRKDPFLYRVLRTASNVIVDAGIMPRESDIVSQRAKMDRAERSQHYGAEKKKTGDTRLN